MATAHLYSRSRLANGSTAPSPLDFTCRTARSTRLLTIHLQKFEEGGAAPRNRWQSCWRSVTDFVKRKSCFPYRRYAHIRWRYITQVKTESVRHSLTPLPPSHNLPALLTPLVGRTEEIAAISRPAGQPSNSLATLTGRRRGQNPSESGVGLVIVGSRPVHLCRWHLACATGNAQRSQVALCSLN